MRLLDLPEGIEVAYLFADPGRFGIRIMLVGETLPEVEPGCEPSHLDGKIKLLLVNEDGQLDPEGRLYARYKIEFPESA